MLTGPEILKRMKQNGIEGKPDIVIDPFNPDCLGSNSYDVHLSNKLKIYKNTIPNGMRPIIPFDKNKKYTIRDLFINDEFYNDYLKNPYKYDVNNPEFLINPFIDKETVEFDISDSGVIVFPRFAYLGSTVEWTENYNLFSFIDGKSSIGRNFILIHWTAGRGDDGFKGNWTLEISVKHPTLLIPNMRIGQIYFTESVGERKPYDKNPNSHYVNQKGPTPASVIKIEK